MIWVKPLGKGWLKASEPFVWHTADGGGGHHLAGRAGHLSPLGLLGGKKPPIVAWSRARME